MSQAANVVRTTTNEMAHSALTLPAPIIEAVTLFNKVHRIWRWFRLGEIYSNPDNFLKLAAGHGLNLALGNTLILRISAVCVLIATRILECVEQHFKLQASWHNLVAACRGDYPTPIYVKWEVKSSQSFLSTSTVSWWKYHTHSIWDRTQRIALCSFHLCKNAFILSMRITDAIETFSLSPKTHNEGINLLFINGTKWVDKLVDNKHMLIEGLKSNKKLIDKILAGINSPLTADQLIKTTVLAFDKTEKFHDATESINKTVGSFITACVKKWGYEFMYELGLNSLVPPSLIPSPNPPWEIPKHQNITIRYIPDLSITRPSMKKY